MLEALAILLPICSASGFAPTSDQAMFADATRALGVEFTHRHFGTGEKYMPENMGAGVAVLDVDGDGRLDIYLLQGAPIGDAAAREPSATNRLFRQRDDGTLEDVTENSGAGDPGYGMGVTFGDIDGDGDLDLYVANFGPNALYRNRGDGTFEQVREAGGADAPGWSTGATFVDVDRDGDLDLLVATYLDFSLQRNRWCGTAERKLRSYCHPDVYDGAADHLFLNDGRGGFSRAPAPLSSAPAADKGLGVVAFDADGDGDQDLFVANDSTANDLYLTSREGFVEEALLAGVALNGAGAPEASMGIAVADFDGDLRLDLVLTHLDEETNTLYRGAGGGVFVDATERSGLAGVSRPWVGFGTVAEDFDLDGDVDLFVANGHIIDNIAEFAPGRSHAQPAQLFLNRGDGVLEDASVLLGLDRRLVGRGAAGGDLDRDGDVDLIITQNDGPALVLINGANAPERALAVELRGRRSNPQGYGARLELRSTGGTAADGEPTASAQVRLLLAAQSYLSQGAPEALFGLRDPGEHELRIRWPSGTEQRIAKLLPGFLYRITEGEPEPERTALHSD